MQCRFLTFNRDKNHSSERIKDTYKCSCRVIKRSCLTRPRRDSLVAICGKLPRTPHCVGRANTFKYYGKSICGEKREVSMDNYHIVLTSFVSICKLAGCVCERERNSS
jgi:hypothetical protein